jgi:hypothetical protein
MENLQSRKGGGPSDCAIFFGGAVMVAFFRALKLAFLVVVMVWMVWMCIDFGLMVGMAPNYAVQYDQTPDEAVAQVFQWTFFLAAIFGFTYDDRDVGKRMRNVLFSGAFATGMTTGLWLSAGPRNACLVLLGYVMAFIACMLIRDRLRSRTATPLP